MKSLDFLNTHERDLLSVFSRERNGDEDRLIKERRYMRRAQAEKNCIHIVSKFLR